MSKKIVQWVRLGVKWFNMLRGKSYYHLPQGVGKKFHPGELLGYFNDLTLKCQWRGNTDDEGVPVNMLQDGRKVYFVTTVVQKALGHWDKWLLSDSEKERNEFFKLCQWLLDRQDEKGGWPVWDALGVSCVSPYSAMTQGECVSAFVRAWRLSNDIDFIEGAKVAFQLMCAPVEEGGTAIYEGSEVIFEEEPEHNRSAILNGWMFALFGAYDFWLALKDKKAKEIFQQSLRSLKRNLWRYDCGYWSYYDVKGHLASPFYHDLHISQLSALLMVEKDAIIDGYRRRWALYRKNRFNLIRAFMIKALQKLQEPEEATVVK